MGTCVCQRVHTEAHRQTKGSLKFCLFYFDRKLLSLSMQAKVGFEGEGLEKVPQSINNAHGRLVPKYNRIACTFLTWKIGTTKSKTGSFFYRSKDIYALLCNF